jgi:hypothetical protein
MTQSSEIQSTLGVSNNSRNGSSSSVTLGQELRKVDLSVIKHLGEILSNPDDWKSLMSHIPSERLDRDKRFDNIDIRYEFLGLKNLILGSHMETTLFSAVERASHGSGRTAFEILVENWGTMGRKRPTLKLLMIFLMELNLLRAASYISKNYSNCKLQN